MNNFERLEAHYTRGREIPTERIKEGINGNLEAGRAVGEAIDLYMPKLVDYFLFLLHQPDNRQDRTDTDHYPHRSKPPS